MVSQLLDAHRARFCNHLWFAREKKESAWDAFACFFFSSFSLFIRIYLYAIFHRRTKTQAKTIAAVTCIDEMKWRCHFFCFCAHWRQPHCDNVLSKLMKLTNVQRVTVFIWPSSFGAWMRSAGDAIVAFLLFFLMSILLQRCCNHHDLNRWFCVFFVAWIFPLHFCNRSWIAVIDGRAFTFIYVQC